MSNSWVTNHDGVILESQNRGHQRAYCSSPGWYVRVDSHGDDTGWGKFLTRLQELSDSPTSRDIKERLGGMDEGVKILLFSVLDTPTDL
jgi:hypothetical protein